MRDDASCKMPRCNGGAGDKRQMRCEARYPQDVDDVAQRQLNKLKESTEYGYEV